MPAPKSKKKVLKYSDREKLTAVRLSEAPGVKVKDVAAGLWAMWMYSIVRKPLGGGFKSAAVVGLAW